MSFLDSVGIGISSSIGTGLNIPIVNTFADLPDPTISTDLIYEVLTTTGVYLINRKVKGYYRSNGVAWSAWEVDQAGFDYTDGEFVEDKELRETSQVINNDRTLSASHNALSVGSVAIALAKTVTIPLNQEWKII
ncbi:MAG: hypothetical protein L6Q54_11615 [Leptospiraceae bacterium]|nr:hypothetical protein [Leptospiraceae bacterium]